MLGRSLFAATVACAVASLGCPKTSHQADAGALTKAPAVEAASTSSAANTSPDVARDPPEGASVYFATIRESPCRIYFDRSGATATGIWIDSTAGATPIVFRAELLSEHRFRLTSHVVWGKPPDDQILVEGTFDPDRGLRGARRYATNEPEVVSPAHFESLGPDERAFEGSFVGVLGQRTRVRAKLRALGGSVTGFYRYTSSKTDLRLAGTLDPATRRVALTETSTAGTVTGRLEGLVLSARALAGFWISPDGSRRLPFRLQGGEAYPEIQTLAGGARVTPQEAYRSTKDGRCVASTVYPEISGLASRDLSTKLNREWKRRAFMIPSGDNASVTLESVEKRIATPLTAADCLETSTTEDRYALTSLTRTLLAAEIEHYAQYGDITGSSWSDCGVSDLETGEWVELQRVLDDAGREKLGELVAQSLHREAADAGQPDFDPIYHHVTTDTALCVTPDGVRVMIYGNRVFGPFPRVLPYRSVAPLFSVEKFRSALTR